MITASTSKQFIFRVPQGFVPAEVESKYYPYLSQRMCIYPNLTEYLNAHLQKVALVPVTSRSKIRDILMDAHLEILTILQYSHKAKSM